MSVCHFVAWMFLVWNPSCQINAFGLGLWRVPRTLQGRPSVGRLVWNPNQRVSRTTTTPTTTSALYGWVQRTSDGEWEWAEDDPTYSGGATTTMSRTETQPIIPSATPQLPSGSYRPKQSLGQNYLKDPNTVAKIIRAFHQDAVQSYASLFPVVRSSSSNPDEEEQDVVPDDSDWTDRIVELGPGAGALTDKLVETYGADKLECIEIDDRSVELLQDKHPSLHIVHADVLQVDYPQMARRKCQSKEEEKDEQPDVLKPLVVIGNLPYYITSQILFALADASHVGAIQCATVTMQWEVGQRLVASTGTKDYGILSVVFQLYTRQVHSHFKIPPTVFYPKPKVDSALMGLRFCPPHQLQQRLGGVDPRQLRRVLTTAFQQRRKTLRNSLRKLARDVQPPPPPTTATTTSDATSLSWDAALPAIPLPRSVRQLAEQGDSICLHQALPENWASKRPEELTPGQFVELTRQLFGPDTNHEEEKQEQCTSSPLPAKVWRKLKHGPKD